MFWFLLLLIAAFAICSCLSPGSGLSHSAWQAFDSTVSILSRDEDDDTDERHRSAAEPLDVPLTVPRQRRDAAAPTSPRKRRRITPFVAKRVAARHKWRCAACGELLTEDFEIDHHIPLHNGGSDDIANLRPLHKKCHLFKNSLEQRRS